MRMLMRVAIPVDAGNEGIVNGKLTSLARGFIEQHKPEAAYFFADDNGQRCCSMVLDMKDPSEIPGLAEPWFLELKGQITFRPVMNVSDLAAAGPGIERAVKAHGKRK